MTNPHNSINIKAFYPGSKKRVFVGHKIQHATSSVSDHATHPLSPGGSSLPGTPSYCSPSFDLGKTSAKQTHHHTVPSRPCSETSRRLRSPVSYVCPHRSESWPGPRDTAGSTIGLRSKSLVLG